MITTCIINCGFSANRIKEVVEGVSHHSYHNVLYLAHNNIDVGVLPESWHIIRHPGFLTVSQARNLCIKNTITPYILWLDDDIVPTQLYEDVFINGFIDGVGIVGYDACVSHIGFESQWYVNPEIVIDYDYFDSPYAISLEMINDIGNYDETIGRFTGSNTDICITAKSNNWKLQHIINPGLKHYRRARKNKYSSSQEQIDTSNSHKNLRKKHREWKKITSSFVIDSRLQFPDIKKRLGGYESI
tara:strand:- start:1822 stop:2553 length:732 start_codon:yes stop_codon:yes gene_type:complete